MTIIELSSTVQDSVNLKETMLERLAMHAKKQ